jgi:hypothetical protein
MSPADASAEVDMADTCFLCTIGTNMALITAPRTTSNEGFGTCENCLVHACAQHGDRNPVKFRCLDCITNGAAQIIILPTTGAAQDDIDATIDEHGENALFAASPLTATVGAGLFDPYLESPLYEILALLRDDPGAAVRTAGTRLSDEVSDVNARTLGLSLGLPESEGLDELVAPIAVARIQIVTDILLRQFHDAHRPQSPGNSQVRYTLALLASALGSRDAHSLDQTVLHVPGGLYLPPLIILLSTLLVIRISPQQAPTMAY